MASGLWLIIPSPPFCCRVAKSSVHSALCYLFILFIFSFYLVQNSRPAPPNLTDLARIPVLLSRPDTALRVNLKSQECSGLAGWWMNSSENYGDSNIWSSIVNSKETTQHNTTTQQQHQQIYVAKIFILNIQLTKKEHLTTQKWLFYTEHSSRGSSV